MASTGEVACFGDNAHDAFLKSLLSTGNMLRPLMPATLKAHMPRKVTPAKPRPQTVHARRVLILEGCVQPSLSPSARTQRRPPAASRPPFSGHLVHSPQPA